MQRKDFKIITKEHLKTCGEIVRSKGDCMGIECEKCVFSSSNTKLNCGKDNRETLALCEEFLKKFGVDKERVSRNTHLTRNELKKFYTYLKRKYQINGEKTNDINSFDKLEIAIEKTVDEIVKKRLIQSINSL